MKKSILLFAATLFAAATFAQTPTVSASSVTFKYCETTDTVLTVYTLLPYTWRAQDVVVDLNEYATTVHTLVNARGCDSIVSLTLKDPSLPGEFTVDANGTKVRFSIGNLQYRATKDGEIGDLVHNVKGGETRQGEWRFAENQWDFISSTQNNKKSQTYSDWVDIFTYGSSGVSLTTSGSYYAFPYNTTWNRYYSITNTDYDWGIYNEISNGGPANCGWFTLSYDQWSYLLSNRNNASEKLSRGTVNGVKGIIILPDNWETPADCNWTGNKYNDYTTNKYTNDAPTNDWKKMEAAGAVFFPFPLQNTDEGYWTTYGNSSPYFWSPNDYGVTSSSMTQFESVSGGYERYVRLVYKVQ